jgi:succinyldiaminopimelate transaminase
MQPSRFEQLPPYAFPRLRSLLDDIEPGKPEINMSIGEPKHPFPDFIAKALVENQSDYGRYPPTGGTPQLLQAITNWLARRYQLPAGMITPDRNILPLNGTREGLFSVCLAIVPASSGPRPLVLIPNPFYQCYAAAAVAAGADPVYAPATAENGFLPDYPSLGEEILDRTAAVYICSPSNPQGTVASIEYWRTLIELSKRHDFVILADECYAEIYLDAAPVGVLEAAASDGPERVLAFHSLSKRSNAPGLRSGFVAGDAELITRYRQLRNYGGAPNPLPVQAASAIAWSEEAHVEQNRTLYRQKFDLAQTKIGDRFDFYRPEGGFYLWLNVGDGEEAAARLWRSAGVKTLPGRYLARDQVEGDPSSNPGAPFLRLALVNDFETTQEALDRICVWL